MLMIDQTTSQRAVETSALSAPRGNEGYFTTNKIWPSEATVLWRPYSNLCSSKPRMLGGELLMLTNDAQVQTTNMGVLS